MAILKCEFVRFYETFRLDNFAKISYKFRKIVVVATLYAILFVFTKMVNLAKLQKFGRKLGKLSVWQICRNANLFVVTKIVDLATLSLATL